MTISWATKFKIRQRNSRTYSALASAGLFLLGVAITFLTAGTASAQYAAGINQTINYQGRLLTATGAVVPDGTYNMEFKLYQDGDGTATGDTAGSTAGSLKWTEDWIYSTGGANDHRVTVKNGYFSVSLGSLTSLATVNFNWDTLWLSTNIGNVSSAATFSAASGDGEMLPMKRLSSNPYALNSGQLGGLTSGQFVQLGQGIQAATSTTNAAIAINQTGVTANILDLQRGGADVQLINNSGQTLFRPTVDSQTALQVQKAGTTTVAFTVDSVNSRIGIGTGAPAYAVDATGSVNASVSLKVAGTDVCTSTGCTVSGTSGIQNQNSSQQASSNFWISGTGRADTALLTPVIRPTADSTTALRVQNATGTTNVLTVDTTNSRVDVGTVGTPTSQLYVSGVVPTSNLGSVATGTNPDGVVVQGRYAYVVNSVSNSLQVFDISNPASIPAAIGSATTGTNPDGIVVQGRYAYVVNNTSSTLQVFDISNPASIPAAIGSVATGSGPYSLTVQGRYAYVVNATANTLQVFDISNPASIPAAIGSVATGSGPEGVAVQGRYAYVTNNTGNSLQVFDISNPASIPAAIGSVTTGTNPYALTVQGRYAYVVNATANSLQVFDISNPASIPAAVGSVATGSSPRSVSVQGRYAYVVDVGAASLQVFDISNPASIPAVIGTATTGTSPLAVTVQGRYAYVVNASSNSLQSFDLGGTYDQSLEAGSIETSSLAVNKGANVGGNLNVQGGLNASSAQIQGGTSINGTLNVATTTNSAQAFTVQNAASATAFNVDTTTNITTTKDLNVGTTSTLYGPGRLFSDGFESGNTSQWTQGATISGSSFLTTDYALSHNGRYAQKVTMTGSGAATLSTAISNGGSSTYAMRSYVYVTSQNAGNNLDFMSLLASGGAFTLYRDGSTGKLSFANGPAGSTVSVGSTVLTTGAWHKIELVLTLNTGSTGTANVYLDNVNVLAQNGTINTGGIVYPTSLRIGDSNTGRTSVFSIDDVVADQIATGDSSSLNVSDSLHVEGTSAFSGNVVIEPAYNSTTAFQIQNNFGSNLLTADTSNNVLTVAAQANVNGGLSVNTVGTSATQNLIGLNVNSTASPTSATTSSVIGIDSYQYSNSANASGAAIAGGLFGGQYDGTNQTNQIQGSYSYAEFNGTGAANLVVGVTGQAQNGNTGTIASANGLRAYAANNAGGGTITNNYGVYVENQTAGANDYGVYIQGADTDALYVNSGTSFFGGNVLQRTSTNSATAFSVQNSTNGSVLAVDTTRSINLIANPGFDTGITGWAAFGGAGTPTQNTVATNTNFGVASLAFTTTAANQGVTTTSFTQAVPAGSYIVSFYEMTSSTLLNSNNSVTLNDGSNRACTPITSYGTPSVFVGINRFTRVYCNVTTLGNLVSLTIAQQDATARTNYIDAVQLEPQNSTSSPTAYRVGALSIRGVVQSPLIIQTQTGATDAFQVLSNTGGGNSSIFRIDSNSGFVYVGSDQYFGGNINFNSNGSVLANFTGTLNVGTSGAGTLNLGNTNTTSINIGGTSASTTNIGGGDVAHTIGIGSGGSTTAQSIAIGSAASTGSTSIQGGSGGINIGTGALGTPIVIGSLSAVTQIISLGNNQAIGAATTVIVGSQMGASSAVSINGGTNGSAVSVQTAGGGTILLGTAVQSSTLQIGSNVLTTGTQNITVGTNASAGGTTNVSIGSTATAGAGTTTVTARGALTITGGAASTWSTTSGSALTINGGSTLTLQSGSANTFTATATGSGNTVLGSGGTGVVTVGGTGLTGLGINLVAPTYSSNERGVTIGTADANITLLDLDQSTSITTELAANCTTTVNAGGMYYNSNAGSGAIRACVSGGWEDVVTTAGLGILLYGVVPDSGTAPGDLVGITAVGAGPCKVIVGSTNATGGSTVSWSACTAYSGGRKVIVSAATNQATSANATAGNVEHLCLSGTNSQPAFQASAAETTGFPAFAAGSPILCIADVKFGAANQAITAIYDVRTFTTAGKHFANITGTAAALGMIVTPNLTTTGQYLITPAVAGTGKIQGVVVGLAGNVTANTVNAIISTDGPVYVRSTSASGTNAVNDYLQSSATAGYGATVATAPTAVYSVLGIAQSAVSTACAVSVDSCRGSVFTILNIK